MPAGRSPARPRRWGLAPDSFVNDRAATHVIWRLGSRVHQVLSTRGAAHTPAWRAAAAAGALTDLLGAWYLSKSEEFHLVPRLVLDAADLALWCLAAGDDPDSTSDAVIPAVALAAEAGARLGFGGLVVPATQAVVAWAVRRARGHDPRVWQLGWQIMGVAGGAGLSVSAFRRREAVRAEHERDLEARVQAAELAGAHQLATWADPVADLLLRARALVDLGGATPRPTGLVGAWKAALADATRARSAFLGDTLATWQVVHNLHPDLRTAVRLELESDAGTVLLSPAQADELRDRLDQQGLHGSVAVALADPVEARRPGGRRDLVVGGALVSIGPAVGERSWIYDAVPTAFVMSTLWLLPPLSQTREGVRLPAVIAPIVGTAAVTAWAVVQAERQGLVPRRPAVVASGLATLAYTVGSSLGARSPHSPDGASRFGWMLALQGYLLVTEHAAPELSGRDRTLARLGAGGLVAIGWTLAPAPRSMRSLLSEVVWPVGIGLWAGSTARSIARDAARTAEQVGRRDAEAVTGALEQGRERVRQYLSAELSSSLVALASRESELDADIREEAARRLAEVGLRLAAEPVLA